MEFRRKSPVLKSQFKDKGMRKNKEKCYRGLWVLPEEPQNYWYLRMMWAEIYGQHEPMFTASIVPFYGQQRKYLQSIMANNNRRSRQTFTANIVQYLCQFSPIFYDNILSSIFKSSIGRDIYSKWRLIFVADIDWYLQPIKVHIYSR